DLDWRHESEPSAIAPAAAGRPSGPMLAQPLPPSAKPASSLALGAAHPASGHCPRSAAGGHSQTARRLERAKPAPATGAGFERPAAPGGESTAPAHGPVQATARSPAGCAAEANKQS